MSLPTKGLASPTCISCIRSLAWHDLGRPPRPLFLQARGKKTTPNRHHMQYVKLLSDITGYGPKGAILAIPPGQMRNYWYPQGIAQYITGADLLNVKKHPQSVTSRDPEFGKRKVEGEDEVTADGPAVKVETSLLSPRRSEELLQSLLPDYIEFFRPVISAGEKSKPQIPEAKVATTSSDSQPIFGSVSTQDLAQNITEFMALKGAEATFADAGRVVLRPEDIRLVRETIQTGVEDDRIKVLGDFTFELHIKGAGVVQRKVRVRAQT